ncbi:MAG: sortase [Patescibacteria group bacterium]|mgnify:CR=1 FL=1
MVRLLSPQVEPPTEHEAPRKAPMSVFLATVFVVFVLTLSAADSVGFVPNYIDGSNSGPSQNKIALSNLPQLGGPLDEAVVSAEPARMTIPALGKDLPIQNPATKDIDALTEVLKAGPARYVDSAKLGEKGNMLLFGHSSHLPVVRNQMYKAFNDIETLAEGDSISVFGGGKEYIYRVTSVRMADAKTETIDLSKGSARLTLVTCNTLGEKTARWIVEAEFVGTVPSAD